MLERKKTLKYKKQWEYNEEVAASPRVAAYRDLTPHTVEPSQALVTLNGFVTLVTLGGAVPFHPEMMHYLRRDGVAAYRGGKKEVMKEKTWRRKNKMYTKERVTRQLKKGEKNKRRKRNTDRRKTNDAVCVFKPPHSGN